MSTEDTVASLPRPVGSRAGWRRVWGRARKRSDWCSNQSVSKKLECFIVIIITNIIQMTLIPEMETNTSSFSIHGLSKVTSLSQLLLTFVRFHIINFVKQNLSQHKLQIYAQKNQTGGFLETDWTVLITMKREAGWRPLSLGCGATWWLRNLTRSWIQNSCLRLKNLEFNIFCCVLGCLFGWFEPQCLMQIK